MFNQSLTNNVKSLSKAIAIIKCFTPDRLQISAADIAKSVGISRPTAYRLIATLVDGGFIQKKAGTEKYMIGADLYAQGSLYLESTDTLKEARPVMEALNKMTGEAINLGILDKSNIIFIMKEETRGAFRFFRHVGSVLPAHASAMGLALLSELSDSKIDELYLTERLESITKKTITTKAELKRILEQVRQRGASIDIEGNVKRAVGIASVIHGVDNKALAAMSITIPLIQENYDYHK